MSELSALDRLRARRLKEATDAMLARDRDATIQSISSAAGMHGPTLSAYLSQRRRVTEDAIRRLAPVLIVPVSWLLAADQDQKGKETGRLADSMIVTDMDRAIITRFRELRAKDAEAAGAWLFLGGAAIQDRKVRVLLTVLGRLREDALRDEAAVETTARREK